MFWLDSSLCRRSQALEPQWVFHVIAAIVTCNVINTCILVSTSLQGQMKTDLPQHLEKLGNSKAMHHHWSPDRHQCVTKTLAT